MSCLRNAILYANIWHAPDTRKMQHILLWKKLFFTKCVGVVVEEKFLCFIKSICPHMYVVRI